MTDGQALTSGVIDLLFESESGWQVRDYKTDLNLDASGYERQLRIYRDALRRVGIDTAETALVDVRQIAPDGS